MEQNNAKTLEFIQLVKCIIEYYASTKTKNANTSSEISFDNEMNETAQLLNSLNELNISEMAIEIPVDIDKTIKDVFLSQLKSFQIKNKKNIN